MFEFLSITIPAPRCQNDSTRNAPVNSDIYFMSIFSYTCQYQVIILRSLKYLYAFHYYCDIFFSDREMRVHTFYEVKYESHNCFKTHLKNKNGVLAHALVCNACKCIAYSVYFLFWAPRARKPSTKFYIVLFTSILQNWKKGLRL